MRIGDILDMKGSRVVTVSPAETVREALLLLRLHRIGALVVSSDGNRLDGILSERDIVHWLAADGDAILDRPVTALMTKDVIAGSRDQSIEEVMSLMTRRRIRHLPILEDGRLVGIASIGDVVKMRLDDLAYQTDALKSYIAGH